MDNQNIICLKCNKPLSAHRRYTAQDIADSQGATYKAPVNGYLSPLSPSVVGQWVGHDPMLAADGRTVPFN